MFSERLRKLRTEKDLSQKELGDMFSLSKQTISGYESGSRNPDPVTLQKLAGFFAVSTDYLLGRTDIKKPIDKKFDILSAMEDNDFQITSGDTPLTPEQRLGIARVLDNPSVLKPQKFSVPMLGHIRAGIPLLSEQNVIGEVSIPDDLAGRADFALRVSGDSMVGAGISDGDIVICKQAERANQGQVVVALVNHDETTLKFLIKENGREVLRAANPRFEDIALKQGDEIQGYVVKVMKEPPTINTYKEFLYYKNELQDWNEVLERAVTHGLKPGFLRDFIDTQIELAKRLVEKK